MAAGAQFTVAGQGTGQRTVAARDFFLGYRKVDLAAHEVLVKVRIAPVIECRAGEGLIQALPPAG